MQAFLFIFLGGGIGSLFRFGLAKWLNTETASFQFGTFAANVIACFILGGLVAYAFKHNMSDSLKFLLITGFCGGFSTFSTFSFENFEMIQAGQLGAAFLYTTISFFTGLLAIFAGLKAFENWPT